MTYCTKCKTWMTQTAMGLPAPDAYSRSVRFWGDLYECPGCGAAVLASFGQAEEIKDEDPPTEEMYESILEKVRAASDPLKQLLDDIAAGLPEEHREQIHAEMEGHSPEEFIRRYFERYGPMELLEEALRVSVEYEKVLRGLIEKLDDDGGTKPYYKAPHSHEDRTCRECGSEMPSGVEHWHIDKDDEATLCSDDCAARYAARFDDDVMGAPC